MLIVVACASASDGGQALGDDPEERASRFYQMYFGSTLESSSLEQVEFEQGEAWATENMTAECMRAEGFDYEIAPIDVDNFQPDLSVGMSRTEYARTFGLGIATVERAPLDIEPPPAFSKLSDAEREEFMARLYGPEGCAESARAERGKIEKIAFSYMDRLRILFEEFNSDPRVVAANEDWSRCMTRSGFDFRDQAEMRASIETQLFDVGSEEDLDRLRSAEIASAVESEACLELQGYVLDAILSDVHEQFDAKNRGAIQAEFESALTE